ncbi:MAG: ABC transporter substrate-binding protein [Anaerolineae bacterium]
MRAKWLLMVVAIAVTFSIVMACAAPAPGEPQVVKETVVVEKQVVVTPTTAPPPAGPQRGGTLNISLGPDFVSFDPFYDITNMQFKPMLFDAPIRISDDGQFEPWLAESFEVSGDGLTVTLHLRKGVKFHNGREMTADDVVWSVERACNQDLGHHLADRFTTCAGANAVDDYTVEIHYSEITHSALDGIARLYIFPQEAADTIETTPVGTGPFKLEEWVPGDHLTLVRFEDYWREGEPYLDKVVVKPIPDEQSRMVNLLAGSIDLLMGVPLADITLLEQAPDVSVIRQQPGFAFDAFIFNVTHPPFDNTLVRQAMNYAVDRDKMRELAYHGQGVMTTLPWGPTSWAYPKALENYYTFDLDKAKELLTEAGYPDGFKTEMTIRGTGGVALDTAQVYQQDLAKIGVEMEILPTELPQYWPKLFDGDFAVVSHATGEATVDPSGVFIGAACCRPFRNFFQITENKDWFPKYKAIIDQSSTETDQEKRKALYHDAAQILMEQGWTIPLGWRQQIFALKDNVQGFRTDMDGLIWLNETWLAQ